MSTGNNDPQLVQPTPNTIQTGWGFRLPASLGAILLVVLGWVLFGWGVKDRGLWSAHEGRAAQNATTILQDGKWLTPTLFTEQADQQKPPLYYWLVAILSVITGGEVNAWTVRLPATLTAMGGLLVVYAFGRKMWDWETGFAAAVILATTTRFAWDSRVGRIDMPLTFVCLMALYLFWAKWDRQTPPPLDGSQPSSAGGPPWQIWMSFYAFIGLGCLLKGPVAIILIMAPIVTYLTWSGQPIFPILQPNWRTTWKRHHFLAGFGVIVLVAAPWYVYAIYTTGGEYFWEFLVYHNLDRALGTNEALKPGPIAYYIPRLLVDSFPWSILFPAIAITLWQNQKRLRSDADPWPRTYLFLLSWIASQFVFLSLVSFKRADYLLPVFPAMALLVAGWLTDRLHRFETRIAARPAKNPRRRARLVLASAFIAAMIAAPLLLWGASQFRKKGGLVKTIFEFDFIAKYLNPTDRFMMQHVERLLRENWPLLLIGVVVIVASIWVFQTGWHDRRNRRILAGLALPWVVCFLFQVHLILPAIDPLREMSMFADEIRTLATPDRPIYYFGKFDADLVFHAGRPARVIGDWEVLVELGARPEPCYVVMKESQVKWIKEDPRMSQWSVIADNRQTAFGEHRDARVLVTNYPFVLVDLPQPPGRGTATR